ncbi:MAG TPA: hypothetical protein VEZ90_11070 [Blastocatellia bacterium]|nr:hypothetical protein [Blastocatellia bacterium]
MPRKSNKSRVPTRIIGSGAASGLGTPAASRTVRPRTVRPVGDIESAIEAARAGGFSVTPLQLLGVVMKSVLKSRITDEEVDRISSVYYDAIRKWWD